MNIIDKRNCVEIEAGDIVINENEEKYLVVYETSCIAWHFINIEYFKFDCDIHNSDIKPKIGDNIQGLGRIITVVKSENIDLRIH